MQKLVWQNANGDEINLTSGNYGITEWEGFSNTSLNIQSQQVPFQDGGVFLDALIEQRELSVTLKMQDHGKLEERYRMRRELIHALNPKLGEGYLIYTNNFTSKRIKCIAQIPLFETHNSNDSGTPKASLSWTASDPYWEDLEETVVELSAGEMKKIENAGDVKSQIKVEIKGNLLNASIVKLDTKQRIKINDYVNEPLVINTNIGSKSIYKKSINYELEYTTESGDSFATNGDILISVCTWYGFIINTYNERKALPFYNNMKRSITYGNGQFVICTGNKYYTSANGESWSEGTLLPTGTDYNSKNVIIYKNGFFFLFIHRYSQFEIYKSVDLTNLELLYTEEWNGQKEIDVVYGNNMYLIKYNINTKGELLKYQQTIEKTITENPYPFKKIAFGNGLFVFSTNTDILQTTTDGEILTNITEDTIDSNIIFFNGKFIKTGTDYFSRRYFYTSVDCINWKKKSIASDILDLIVYNNCVYLFGTNNYLAVTTDFENLFVIYNKINTNIYNNGKISNILFINEKYWGALDLNLQSSEDGVDFKEKQITPNIHPFSIQNGNGVIVIVSETKIAVFNESELNNTSINCRVVMENLSGIKGVKYFNGKFIVYGTNILLVSNDNGEHWTSVNVPNGNYDSVAYGNGYYIIASSENAFILRTIDFTNIETIETPYLKSVCFGNGIFLALKSLSVGGIPRWIFIKSQDGVNWAEIQTNFIMGVGYAYMIYENGYFIGIIGDKFITSNDGTNFSAQPNTVYMPCEGIAYGNESFIFLQNRVISKTFYNRDTNLIYKLSADSDMSLGLEVGTNVIKFAYDEGSANAILSYRQKYIGV